MNECDDQGGAEIPAVLPIANGISVEFRRLRSPDDYVGMAHVRTDSIEHDKVDLQSAREGVPSVDDLAVIFPLQNMVGHPDLLIATVDDRIIGYAHVCWRWTETTGERVYLHLGYVLPSWRKQGIGAAMVAWSRGRIRELAVADEHDGPMSLASNASSSEVEASVLLQESGYSVARELSDMVTDLDTTIIIPTLPDTVEVRTLVPKHYRAVYEAYKDAVSPMWTTTMMSDADLREFITENFEGEGFDQTLCHVAWVGDEVVGYTLCRKKLGIGVLGEVGVRRSWQRQGIGRSLLARSLEMFQYQGLPRARLFTDAADGLGARSLYESFGFRESKRHLLFRQPLEI